MKGTENTRADVLNKKPGYKDNRKPKDFAVFLENKNNFILNKQ
jgi:hypothetical protein